MSSLFVKSLQGHLSERIPFWFMRQAGRYLPEYREIRSQFPSFLDFCYHPKSATEVTLQPIRRFDMDAAILFSDILVIPDALGQTVWFEQGEGPKLEPIQNDKDIAALDVKKIDSHLEPVFEAVASIRSQLPKNKALIGFAGSPWTVACYMIEGSGSKDFQATRQFAYRTRTSFSHLIDLLVEATSRYLLQQIKAGADCVQLFDSWAGVLPETEFAAWVIEPTRRIVENIRKQNPEVPIIGFARGAGPNLLLYAEKTKVSAVGIDTAMPLEWTRKTLGNERVLQGNLDPLLLASDLEGAKEETLRILDTWKSGPFIFNLGHGIVPHTPVEHVQAISELIRNYRR